MPQSHSVHVLPVIGTRLHTVVQLFLAKPSPIYLLHRACVMHFRSFLAPLCKRPFVQWSEDVTQAGPIIRVSRVRLRMPTLAREHDCT